MKTPLTAYLPALALLALSGCASTSALTTTTEDDGVYYSSQDRTTAVVRTPAPGYDQSGGYSQQSSAPANGSDEANPDYRGNGTQRNGSSSSEYYDDSYASSQGTTRSGGNTYIFNSPYAGPGVAYYAPRVYAPYTMLSYGWGGGYCGYAPFGAGFYDPFYDPFYSPFGYGFGPGVSISIGFGRPWGGWGFPGYGFGPAFGYGWGGGFYDPYWGGGWGGRGFYGAGWGYGGGWGGRGFGYGGRNVRYIGNGNYGYDRNGRNTVNVGPRTDRWTDGRPGGNRANAPTTAPASPGNAGGGRRVFTDEVVAPVTAGSGTASPATQPETIRGNRFGGADEPSGGKVGRNRPTQIENYQFGTADQPVKAQGYGANEGEIRTGGGRQAPVSSEPSYGKGGGRQAPVSAEPSYGNGGGRRWQAAEQPQGSFSQPAAQPETKPQYGEAPQGGGRRGGFFREYSNEPAPDKGQDVRQQRTYEQPRRVYEQPQRVYERPQATYERPQRSYEQPSNSGSRGGFGGSNGGFGGSNSGGGGGRRGGRGME